MTELAKGFDPSQPRVPAGSAFGGRWTDRGGQAPAAREAQDAKAKEVAEAVRELAKAHDLKASVAYQPLAKQVVVSMGNDTMQAVRTFYLNGGQLNVSHDTFSVYDVLRDQGVSKRFLADSMDMYEELGVNRIKVETVQTGSYAWARFGFKPNVADAEQRRSLNGAMDFAEGRLGTLYEMGSIPKPVYDVAMTAIHSKDLWAVADLRYPIKWNGEMRPLGHELTRETYWTGELDLKDPVAMHRFNTYTGRVGKAFNPNQPRAPKGTAEGGQWTSDNSWEKSIAAGKWPGLVSPYDQESGKVTQLVDEVEKLLAEGKAPTSTSYIGNAKGLLATQTWLSDEGGGDPVFPDFEEEYGKAPILVQTADGKLHIIDGHHTVAYAVAKGDAVRAFVFKSSVTKFDPQQPRKPKGDPEGGQWVSTTGQKLDRMSDNRDEWPEHARKLHIPPAWTDVYVNPDDTGALLAIGKDGKGRWQYIYSEMFRNSQARAKYLRMLEMDKQLESILKQIHKDQGSSDDILAQHADVAMLMLKTGIRPGSLRDRGGAVTAYGATTLLAEHLLQEGSKVTLNFTGKKGVQLSIPIERSLQNMLMERKAATTALSNKRLFPSVTDRSLRTYVSKLGTTGGFTPKDFRTHVGTALARELVNDYATPVSNVAYKRSVNAVGTQVAAKLGNTRTVALQSYIDPSVFASWRGNVLAKALSTDIWFGTAEPFMYDYREFEDEDPDDEELDPTPPDMIVMLGFDPAVYEKAGFNPSQPRDELGRWVYHGTSAGNMSGISASGLQGDPYNYFTDTELAARGYAVGDAKILRVLRERVPDLEYAGGSRFGGDNSKTSAAVIAEDIEYLDDDGAWKPLLSKAFNPNQPRHPKGTPEGGQWARMYRGTAEGQPLAEASDRGRFGPGLYLSRQPGVASQYGTVVTEYDVNVPLFDASLRWMSEQEMANLEASLFNQMTADEVKKVREWWPTENAKVRTGEDVWEIISRRLGDARAQELIRNMGYRGIDGIGDGAETVIFDPSDVVGKAFDPNQPRHPKGDPKGGQWKDKGGEGRTREEAEDKARQMAASASGRVNMSSLQTYIDTVATQFNHAGMLWYKAYGKQYEIDGETFIGGTPQQCYKNAFLAGLENPDLTYVEGFMAVHGVPIHHAWLVTKDGKVRDYTLGPESFPKKDPASIVTEYFGVPMQRKFVDKQTLKNGVYGLTAGHTFKDVVTADPKKVVEGYT